MIIVGALFAVIFGSLVHFLGNYAMPIEGRTFLITFTGIGFAFTRFVGYRPDPIDWAGKSKITGNIVSLVYVIISTILFFLDPPG